VRSDRPRARRIAREALWDWGLVKVARDLRDGYQHRTVWRAYVRGSLMALTRVVGTIVGFFEGIFVKVQNGHFST
jgi:hypothetical protein